MAMASTAAWNRPSSDTKQWYDGEGKSVHHSRTIVTDCAPITDAPTNADGWKEVRSRRVTHRVTHQTPPSWQQQEREQHVAVQFQGYKVLMRWQTKIEQTRSHPLTTAGDTPASEQSPSRVILCEEWEDEMIVDLASVPCSLGLGTPAAAFSTSSPPPSQPPTHYGHHMQLQFPHSPSGIARALPCSPRPGPQQYPPHPFSAPSAQLYPHHHQPTQLYPHHHQPAPPAQPYPHHHQPAPPAFLPPAPPTPRRAFGTPYHHQPQPRRQRPGPFIEDDFDQDDVPYVGAPPTPRGTRAAYGPATFLDQHLQQAPPRKGRGKGKRRAMEDDGDEYQ